MRNGRNDRNEKRNERNERRNERNEQIERRNGRNERIESRNGRNERNEHEIKRNEHESALNCSDFIRILAPRRIIMYQTYYSMIPIIQFAFSGHISSQKRAALKSRLSNFFWATLTAQFLNF
jgi:hypothetical protein